MKAEILSYSRSRGLFAGISLNGARLHADDDANQIIYGKDINAKKIITKPGNRSELMISELDKISPSANFERKSDKKAEEMNEKK
jgi:lipid-binding SYLF domain-containing protein